MYKLKTHLFTGNLVFRLGHQIQFLTLVLNKLMYLLTYLKITTCS